jgi:CRP-like cAMP-binding protein
MNEPPARAHRLALRATLSGISELSPGALDTLVGAFRARELEPGQRQLCQGDVCAELAFVGKGLLVSRAGEERESSCDVFAEGQFATDYVSFLTASPATVEIAAVERCELLVLARLSLEELYRTVPGAERLGRRIAEAQFIGAVQRAGALLREPPAVRYQALRGERPELLQRLPQYLLAQWLGVTPESLSRIRRRLAVRQRGATKVAPRD